MHHSHRRAISAAAALVLLGVFSAAGAKASAPEIKPKHAHTMRGQARTRPSSGNGISFHGGRVIANTRVVEIFYGNKWTQPAIDLVHDFDTHFGGSAYYNINTTYTGVKNVVSVVGPVTNVTTAKRGLALSDAAVQGVVADAIAANPTIGNDSSTVWMVLGSADVNLTSGYGTQYCGWHTHATFGTTDTGYLTTIDAARAPSACEQQTASSPNGNPGIDGMLSVVAHEIEETSSDVDLNAWYDTRGYENADKCAWTFGTTYKVFNGSLANMTLGSRDYLIQRNWVNANGGRCDLHL